MTTSFEVNALCRCRDAVKQLIDCKKVLGLSQDEETQLDLISVCINEDLEDIKKNNITLH